MTTARTAAVVTVSDSSSRGERADLSGPATAELLRQHGFDITHQEIVPDEQPMIEAALRRLAEQVQLIVTTGGTGIAARDVTPEATRAVCSKLIDGIPEKMRATGLAQTPFAVLSRGLCGIRGQARDPESARQPDGRGAIASRRSSIFCRTRSIYWRARRNTITSIPPEVIAHNFSTPAYNSCLANRVLPEEPLDPLTHFLTGGCLGRAGFNRKIAAGYGDHGAGCRGGRHRCALGVQRFYRGIAASSRDHAQLRGRALRGSGGVGTGVSAASLARA